MSNTGACTFAQVSTPGANVTTYHDSSVLKQKTYRYRVKARNSSGDSAYSNTAQVTTPR